MKYLYIGFMLAVGAFIGIAVCFWAVKNREALAKWLVRIINGILLAALAIYVWLDWEAIFNPNTRNGKIAIAVAVFLAIGLVGVLWDTFVSPTPCTCGHAQRRHRSRCKELDCQCHGFVKRCRSCEHADHEGMQCFDAQCTCGYRDPVPAEPIMKLAARTARNVAITLAIATFSVSVWAVTYWLWLQKLRGDSQDIAVIGMVCASILTGIALHLFFQRRNHMRNSSNESSEER